MRLLILGASGLVGNKVLQLALQDPRISSIIALTRRALKAHPKLENYVLDFEELADRAFVESWWQNIEACVSALGTTKKETPLRKKYYDIEVSYPLVVARILKKYNTPAFAYVSSMGADINSHSWYLKTKAQAEKLLQEINFRSLTILRPSFISGDREKKRGLEKIFFKILNPLDNLLPPRWRIVSAQRIAEAALQSVIKAQPGLSIRESESL
jgi:uncharacterized protein YbjT (DUF2867 family)